MRSTAHSASEQPAQEGVISLGISSKANASTTKSKAIAVFIRLKDRNRTAGIHLTKSDTNRREMEHFVSLIPFSPRFLDPFLHIRKECLAMHIGIEDESCIGFLKERRLVPPISPMQEDDAKDAAVILDLNLEATP